MTIFRYDHSKIPNSSSTENTQKDDHPKPNSACIRTYKDLIKEHQTKDKPSKTANDKEKWNQNLHSIKTLYNSHDNQNKLPISHKQIPREGNNG